MLRICGNNLPSLYDLVGDHTSQAILLHSRLVLTRKIEESIVNKKLEELEIELDAYRRKLQKHTADSEEEKLITENLLIEISDQLNTLSDLIKIKCCSIQNYAWISRIRYYHEEDNVYVRVHNLNILYNWEYISVQSPFVMTPKTRRIMR